MNSLRSSPSLRNLLVDLTADLTSMNSTILPDGATVFDNQSHTLWRLNKLAGTTLDSLLGSGLLLKPDDQSDARWFAEAISDGSPYYSASHLSGAVGVVMTSNQWAYLGSTAGTFAASLGNASLFTVNTTTGEVTYNGPPRIVKVGAKASLLNAIGATPITIYAAISRSNDVIAGGTTDYSAFGQQAIVTANVVEEISVDRLTLLNPGTTLRLAFRNATNGDDLTVQFYQMTVSPL
jgi:hypothetical protein